jgi:transposase
MRASVLRPHVADCAAGVRPGDSLEIADRVYIMVDISDDTKIVRRRAEVTGVGRRRRWSDEEKGRIVAGAVAPDAVIADAARRHDLVPQHRRFALPGDGPPAFVPGDVGGVGGFRAGKQACAGRSPSRHRAHDRSRHGAGHCRCRGARRRGGLARGLAVQRMSPTHEQPADLPRAGAGGRCSPWTSAKA